MYVCMCMCVCVLREAGKAGNMKESDSNCEQMEGSQEDRVMRNSSICICVWTQMAVQRSKIEG